MVMGPVAAIPFLHNLQVIYISSIFTGLFYKVYPYRKLPCEGKEQFVLKSKLSNKYLTLSKILDDKKVSDALRAFNHKL